jgi:hypothetical protein
MAMLLDSCLERNRYCYWQSCLISLVDIYLNINVDLVVEGVFCSHRQFSIIVL